MIEKLSTRVERLEGPRFTIEQEIGRLINPQATRLSVFPAYTASLDAAMSLVPEGHSWRVSAAQIGAAATVIHPECEDLDDPYTSFASAGKTPAIALCAAALKSRRL